MCRLLGYLGQPIQLDRLIDKHEHSLVVQSYQPREMTAGLLNADGFGIGWYHPHKSTEPFAYKNTLPIWGDINLAHLSRYVESSCVLANIRSATPGQSIDLVNCQPFHRNSILGVHNGFIENFRRSLYRPIRNQLDDLYYQGIHGNTDSEHIFALLMHNLQFFPEANFAEVLQKTLMELVSLANEYGVTASLNLVISNGQQLVACRCANRSPAPSLYWLQNHSSFPNAIVVASEPFFPDEHWVKFAESSMLVAVMNSDHTETTVTIHNLGNA